MKIGKIKFSICTFQFAISNLITYQQSVNIKRLLRTFGARNDKILLFGQLQNKKLFKNLSVSVYNYFMILWVLGFAMPCRFLIHFTQPFHISLFDILFILSSPLLIQKVINSKIKSSHDCISLLAIIALCASILAGNSNSTVSLFTLFAIFSGVVVSRRDITLFLNGLRIGTQVSLLASIPFLFLCPDLVRENNFFAGFFGTKNGLAFITGLLGIIALYSAPKHLFEFILWFGITAAIGSRGALVAILFSALPLLMQSRRDLSLYVIITSALFTAFIIANTLFPFDRLEFAINIVKWSNWIPLFGIGAGSGYGLDLYFKSLLEFGWFGAFSLLVLILTTLKKRKTDAMLIFILIFGLAHDPTRMPLFWIILLSNSQTSA